MKNTVSAPLLAFVIYVLLLLSRFVDYANLAQNDNVYLVLIILQIIIFMLPAMVYCKLKGEGYIKHLRISPIRAEHVFVIIMAAIILISGEILLRIGLGKIAEISDRFNLYETYTAYKVSSESGLYMTFAFAVIPAICEEFVFRSVLSAEYEKNGVFCAVLATSILFGILHFNLVKLPIYIFCGIILGITFYATRSAIGTMIVHFIYNMFGLFGQKYMSLFYNTTGSEELYIFLVAVIFLLALVLFFGAVSKVYASYSEKNKDSSYVTANEKEKKGEKIIKVLFSPTYLLCILLFAVAVAGLNQ